MSKNKGGRPMILVKKSCRAELRLTEDELQKLLKIEADTGLKRSQLFIKRVLDNQDYLITKDVIQQLAIIGTEIGKVGNNINQLAKHANTIAKNQAVPPEILNQFNEYMNAHLNLQSEVYKVLRQMYRVMRG